jgi:hypothetical protein
MQSHFNTSNDRVVATYDRVWSSVGIGAIPNGFGFEVTLNVWVPAVVADPGIFADKRFTDLHARATWGFV